MSKNKRSLKDIRKQFPTFEQKVNGHSLCYFDSVSTAQMPQSVIDTIVAYYTTYKANVGRGVYTFAEQATQNFENARKNIAQFINAYKQEIIITSGTTHGINLIIQAWATHNIKQGDEIVVSEIEHHSNFVPWQQFAQQYGAVLSVVPVNDSGVIDVQTLQKYLSDKTKLVAIIHTSNVLGTTNDIKALTQAAHAVGARVLIDAAQSVAHRKIDVQDINCDFLVFSGHKLFGPTGVGVLYIKESILPECKVSVFGGGMIFEVSRDQTTFRAAPHCFESGTQPIAQVLGMSAAIDFVKKNIDFKQLQQHETELTKYLIQELQQFDDIEIVSHIPQAGEHSNLVTFVAKKHHAHDIAAYLDQYGIAVRAGNHCVQLYHKKLGVNASVRVSFSMYNVKEEVEFLIKCLKKIL